MGNSHCRYWNGTFLIIATGPAQYYSAGERLWEAQGGYRLKEAASSQYARTVANQKRWWFFDRLVFSVGSVSKTCCHLV